MKAIEIPFGAFDSETIGWTYTIPEGFTAKIEDGKIILEKKDSDEKIRKEIIAFLKHYHTGQGDSVIYDDAWIAYLEKQKEQKPAEWSEKDEKMAYFINQFLEYHEASDPTAKSCKDWFNSRFKSLRPRSHWKPSEKQMNALQYVLGNGGVYNKEALMSLYEHLKNL